MQIKKIFGNNFITMREEKLYLEDIDAKELSLKYKTPFFTFLKSRIVHNSKRLQKIMSEVYPSYKLLYSVKSNYIPSILKIMSEIRLPFEIISELEFNIIKENNLNFNDSLIGGPYLTDDLINQTIQLIQDPLIVVYNIDQLRRVSKLANVHSKKVRIILRLKSPKRSGHLGFQLSEKILNIIFSIIEECNQIEISGILSHYGTQMNNIIKYAENAQYLVESAKLLEKNKKIHIKIFDFGGGFPIASAIKDEKIKEVLKINKKILDEAGYKNVTYYYELGRYITGDAGCCIMDVIDFDFSHESKVYKKSGKLAESKNYIFLNGGNHILPRFAKNPMRFYNLNASLAHYNFPINIYGIVLSDEDIIAKNYSFTSHTKIGDKIIATNCGAYAQTFSNNFPYEKPTLVLIEKDKDNPIEDYNIFSKKGN